MSGLRTVFFGTPEIAVQALRALATISDVRAVVCQPDKAVGRSSVLVAPPVKQAAQQMNLPVHQPTKVRGPDFAEWLTDQKADVGVVLAYGRILTPAVLAAPKHGCINLHASILPSYRGAAPITWAVVRGESETGISVMQMDEGLNTGPVYLTRRLAIDNEETAGALSGRMAELAAKVIVDDLRDVIAGRYACVAQESARATHAPLLKKDDGRIDWSSSAREVHNHVRGMAPWPGAFTTRNAKMLKVHTTRTIDFDGDTGSGTPGEVFDADKRRVLVRCGSGAVAILRAQLEGRKPLDAPELVAGRVLCRGDILGS